MKAPRTPAQGSDAGFSVVDCALEGFRLTRERPAAVATWAVLVFAVQLGTACALVSTGVAPALAAGPPLSRPPPEVALALDHAAPLLVGVLAAGAVMAAVLLTAVLRAVLEPTAPRAGVPRVGAQELRQLALGLWAALVFAPYAVVVRIGYVLAEEAAQGLDGDAGRLLVALAAALACVAIGYPVLRLSLAPAATFRARRVVLFGAWPLTRGRVWSLAGCYAVAALLGLAVFLLADIVLDSLLYAVLQGAGEGPDLLRRVDRPDLGGLSVFLRPETVGAMIAQAVVAALLIAVLLAPAPAIHLALEGRRGPSSRG